MEKAYPKIKKTGIIIGIPAYNEEANIEHLLKDILRQAQINFRIKKIILCSDGSTDKTVARARSLNIPKLEIINNRTRKGVAHRQNQIIQRANSKILVLLNADIRLKDPYFLFMMTNPIIVKQADLVSSTITPLPEKKIIGKGLEASFKIKREVFDNYKKGCNLYTCNGTARAFSKRFYKQLRFPVSAGEDIYSYLDCITKKYKYYYAKEANLFIKLPDNLNDHEKQSNRFASSYEIFSQIFDKDLVKKELRVPMSQYLKSLTKYFFTSPIRVTVYLIVYALVKVRSIKKYKVSETWEISMSSKRVNC